MKAIVWALVLGVTLAWTPAFAGHDGGAKQEAPKAIPTKPARAKPAPAKYTETKDSPTEATKKDAPPKRSKKTPGLSDAQIRKILIQESIDSYPGNCPCPYHVASNGSSCGRRSAYDRPGGYSPLCFAKDVSKEMVQQYRDAHPTESEESTNP